MDKNNFPQIFTVVTRFTDNQTYLLVDCREPLSTTNGLLPTSIKDLPLIVYEKQRIQQIREQWDYSRNVFTHCMM